jgi:hypothetical protein
MFKMFLNTMTLILVAYLCAFAGFLILGKIDLDIGGGIRILMERWELPFAQFLLLSLIWLGAQRKYDKKRFDNAVSALLGLAGRLRRGLLEPSLPYADRNPAELVGGVWTRVIAITAVVFLAGILLRLYHLPFIYLTEEMTIFPYDPAIGATFGDVKLGSTFFATHSFTGSMGLAHPAMFIYTQWLFTAISLDPVVISGMMSLINIVALVVFARFLLYSEPLYFALVCIGLLAVNSALFFYSSIIWGPALMPVAMMIVHIKLYRFIKEKRITDLAWAFAFASASAQCHLGGYTIYPSLAVVAFCFRKEAGVKGLGAALAAAALLCSPYLYYLLVEGGLNPILNTAVGAKREFSLEAIGNLVSMSSAMLSPRIFAYWLGAEDYDFVIRRAVGPFGGALKMATYLAEISFAAGLIRYFAMVVSERSFFPKPPSGQSEGILSFSFQLAGLIVTSATAGYIFFRISMYPHYLTFMFPSYVILAAWAPFKLCKYAAGRAASLFMIAGHTAIAAIVLAAISAGGGHYFVYGPSYRTVLQIKEAVRRINPENRPVDLYLDKRGPWAFYNEYVLKYLIPTDWKKDSPYKMPVMLSIAWDSKRWKYEWFVKSLESRPGERDAALRQALALVPPGARLVVYPDIFDSVRGKVNTVKSRNPALESGVEYVLADIKFFPFVTHDNDYAIGSAKSMLLDRRYGLIYSSNGFLLFKADAQKAADREEYEKISLRFKAVDMHCEGEMTLSDSGSGFARSSLVADGSYMVCGPYIPLTPGQYTATFRLLAGENINHDNPVVVLDVVSDGARVKLAEKPVKPGDFQEAGQWYDFAVAFTVGPKGAQDVELRILYLGGPQIQADLISISMDDQAFNAMLQN